MATQVAGVPVTMPSLRSFTLVHAVFAFAFDMAVLALSTSSGASCRTDSVRCRTDGAAAAL
jgi:uncharacterized membrane protein